MAVDYYGRTIYQPDDINGAIGRRLDTVNSMGDQQNQFANQQAMQAESARQAAIAQRYQQMQTDAVNQGTQNNQAMQNFQPSGSNTTGPTGVSNYTGKPGNNLQNFEHAIGQQESGGNYGSVNKDSGAEGKYQIMPSNLPSWEQQSLGHTVSNAQFMGTPDIQEKVANHMLQGYYNQYGPAGAAVAWYAGPNAAQAYAAGHGASNSSQGNYPAVSGYVQSILSKMGL